MPGSGLNSAYIVLLIDPLPTKIRMKTALCPYNRLSVPLRLVLVSALLFLTPLPFGRLNGAERDLYRSDILTFSGDQKVAVDSLSRDSFLVTLNCKTADAKQRPPSTYSIILRGIDPVERALFQDAQGGKWDHFDLFRAAMIVEGVRDIELIRAYEARLDALVARVTAASRSSGDASPQALTRALFEAMHKEILTQSYSIDCTELSKVMKTGYFNCVSATVLFNCLAEKAGLDVCALEMPGHALSRVRLPNGASLDPETTCPTWFDLQSDKERQLAVLQRIAPAPAQPNGVTAQNAANAAPEPLAVLPTNCREISPVQLAATIYYNIGVDLHAQKRYEEAVAANVKALYLDRDNEQAWTNLLAYINNWALDVASENKGQRYDVATFLLDQGVALDSTYSNFRDNYTYVFYHWIRGLALLGRFDDAQRVFDIANAQSRVPNNETLKKYIDFVNLEAQKRR